MKIYKGSLILITSILGTLGIAQANEKLQCEYANGYFRVSDGLQKWEKYITKTNSVNVQMECGKIAAAAIIDSYFVSFGDGVFKEKYIGSASPESRVLAVKGNMAAAAIGSYFVVARNGSDIQYKYVGSAPNKPVIAVSNNVAVSIFGSYFLASNGLQIQDKYVGSTSNPQVAATDSLGAALAGSYFLGFSDNKIVDKYVSNHTAEDRIARGSYVLATSVGSYFLVLDGKRGQIMESYVRASGKVRVINEVPVLETDSGQVKRYNSAKGQFE